MKLKFALAILTLTLGCALVRGDDLKVTRSPAFVGYMSVGPRSYYAIAPQGGGPSVWLQEQEHNGEYVVRKFDPITEVLTVIRDRETFQVFELKLKSSFVTDRDDARTKPTRVANPVSSGRALSIARAEVKAREKWPNPRIQITARTSNGQYQFMVLNPLFTKTERRLLILDADGRVKAYETLTPIGGPGASPVVFGPLPKFESRLRKPSLD